MKLPVGELKELAEAAEIFMGVHAAEVEVGGDRIVLPVIGGVVLVPDDQLLVDLDGYLGLSWMQPGVPYGDRVIEFDSWFRKLQTVPGRLRPNDFSTRLALASWTVNPWVVPLPRPPDPPAPIYGHLPFKASTPPDAIIYRWEVFPTSRKIDQIARTIHQDAFVAPESELGFVISGFGATARYALPNLLPAIFRSELQPAPNTQIRCGASVPLYGQSGGQVEVLFQSVTANRGPIANPVVLSPL